MVGIKATALSELPNKVSNEWKFLWASDVCFKLPAVLIGL